MNHASKLRPRLHFLEGPGLSCSPRSYATGGAGDTGIVVTQVDGSMPEDDKIDTESALPSSTARYKVRRPKKRAMGPDLEEIPQWLQNIREERSKKDEAWREQRFRMHEEKIAKLDDLINLLKPK